MTSPNNFTFATYVESNDELSNARRLIRSLLKYGGSFSTTPVWIVFPEHARDSLELDEVQASADALLSVAVPEAIRWLFYSGKAYAAASIEEDLTGASDVLAWLDCDTIFLAEPREFDLAQSTHFAYRPVMHNRSGSLYDQAPDAHWQLIYTTLGIREEMLFPMYSDADRQKIRPFFQAGILVVRPARRVLRRWRDDLEKLNRESTLTTTCKSDRVRWVFLHQTALIGAVLHNIARDEMLQLPDYYNYPIFFDRQYGATRAFNSIESVVTMRVVVSLKALGDNWDTGLIGPADKISWLRQQLIDEV